MFCRLSPNHKFFHYDDCDEKATRVPPLDDLTKKICVADIKSIATGKDLPQHITWVPSIFTNSFEPILDSYIVAVLQYFVF